MAIRRSIYTTNLIENLNKNLKRGTKRKEQQKKHDKLPVVVLWPNYFLFQVLPFLSRAYGLPP
ncbi:MAG: hypothetical protein II169_03445 [Lachnospiraceae bacterium]|nr:hypothetical protein [Lachnospiraceae bacterium]